MTKKITKLMLNGEEYEIREYQQGGRQPGTNTLAYYPLTSQSTVYDMKGSGTAYDLTNNGVTFGTNAGVDCASFDGSSSKLTATIGTLPQGANARTTSLWLYQTGSMGRSIMGYGANRTRYGCWEMVTGGSTGEGYALACYYIDEYTHVTTLNSWLLFTVTYDGSIIKTYINGELKSTSNSYTLETSGTIFEIGNPYNTNFYQGYASNVIIEDKARTAQEIQDYYDQTKGDYGIS